MRKPCTRSAGTCRTLLSLAVGLGVVGVGGIVESGFAQCEETHSGGLPERIAAARTLPERIDLAQHFAKDFILDRYSLPGMSLAVAIDGKIVWSEGFGFADVERKISATAKTRFRVGSVSKVFTAAAIALLYEQGKLDLDAPVQRYVPEFPSKGAAITTRQLTAHTAGIRHYNENEMKKRNTKHYNDVVDALHFFKNDPLVFPPGEGYAYSSYGWTLISAVVQRAADQDFLDFMRGNVFQPLGMKDTCADDVTVDISNRAAPYSGSTRVTSGYDPSFLWAGGGYLSTAEDMVRFGSAFLPASRFLKPETLKQMFTKQKKKDGKEVSHGIAWFVDTLDNGKPVYHHGGMTEGGTAILLVRPEDRIVVAYAGNSSSGPDEMEANLIAGIFLGSTEGLVLTGSLERRRKSKTVWAALRAAHESWRSALANHDIDTAMSVISEDFTGPIWANKAALRQKLSAAFETGDVAVDDSGGSFALRGLDPGSFAHISRLKVSGPLFDGAMRISLKWEESGWKIINWRADDE